MKKVVCFLSQYDVTLCISKGCKGNDTANCVKSMKLGVVVSFKILIQKVT